MSTLNVNTVQSSTSNPPIFKNSGGDVAGTLCRAWVNFNGVGTVAVRGSFNVSSITDEGTGQYMINFASEMPTSNYVALSNSGYDDVTYEEPRNSSCFQHSTSSVRVRTGYSAFNAQDEHRVEVAIFA